MKPVDQTRFGVPIGNCFTASLASILEVGVEDLQEFEDLYRAWAVEHYETNASTLDWDSVQAGLRSRGVRIVYWDAADVAPKGYSIAGGTSGTGLPHACVALDGRVVHDPSPNRSGLDRVEEFYLVVPFVEV